MKSSTDRYRFAILQAYKARFRCFSSPHIVVGSDPPHLATPRSRPRKRPEFRSSFAVLLPGKLAEEQCPETMDFASTPWSLWPSNSVGECGFSERPALVKDPYPLGGVCLEMDPKGDLGIAKLQLRRGKPRAKSR